MINEEMLLVNFVGDWQLKRQIIDLLHGQDGQLYGSAKFTPLDDGLLYEEQGRLTLSSGTVLRADRTYLWSDDACGIVVCFENGTEFHRFELIKRSHGSTHFCGDDVYNVAYDFERWPNWSATWNVLGPRKNYKSVSRYNRI